ncbi:uncharacterized protein RCC_09447 [Ramularia collo-cygni]|uniref:Uncharacterized protein n=1 Tax=Ramularia collo-cygni TaxID=112498 RepID=A0A2D3V6X2_9PEZI|nr:uncharacterized protein RCC_09447 [Ramularia collo-cygni]CZT23733.1 uncharacterized protein RCC_09447 [Ramularia collo-cygni]
MKLSIIFTIIATSFGAMAIPIAHEEIEAAQKAGSAPHRVDSANRVDTVLIGNGY